MNSRAVDVLLRPSMDEVLMPLDPPSAACARLRTAPGLVAEYVPATVIWLTSGVSEIGETKGEGSEE
jgi:hypothetical protein